MRRQFAAALATAAVILAAHATAQDSNTTCFEHGNYVNCNTHTNQGSGGAVAGFAQGFNESLDRQGGLANIVERARGRRAVRARRARYVEAGKLIDAHKCPEARSFALASGDLDLAQRVASLCPAAPGR